MDFNVTEVARTRFSASQSPAGKSYYGDMGIAMRVRAPTDVVRGQPFPVEVTVVDEQGNTVPGYIGTLAFGGLFAEAPLDHANFTAADWGMKRLEVTLVEPGLDYVWADSRMDNASGRSGPVLVHHEAEGLGPPLGVHANITFGQSADLLHIGFDVTAIGVNVHGEAWCSPDGMDVAVFGQVAHQRPSQGSHCLAGVELPALDTIATPFSLKVEDAVEDGTGAVRATLRGDGINATLEMHKATDGWRPETLRMQGRISGLVRLRYGSHEAFKPPVADFTIVATVEASEKVWADHRTWTVESHKEQIPLRDLEARVYGAGDEPLATFRLGNASGSSHGFVFHVQDKDGVLLSPEADLHFSGGVRMLQDGDTLSISSADQSMDSLTVLVVDLVAQAPLRERVGGGDPGTASPSDSLQGIA